MKKGIHKQTVVQTACAIVDREGTQALSLARVAAELSIKGPSLYNHVASLADLKKEIAVIGVQELADELATAMVGKAGKESLKAGLISFRSFVRKHPGVWQILCGIPGKEVDQDPLLSQGSEKILKTLAAGLEPYRLPQDQLIHSIRSLRSLVHGFASLELAEGFGMPFAIDDSFDWMVESFLRGLERR